MSNTTGPLTTLPGTRHRLPAGTACDIHPDRLAVVRIQGETDSFGAELNDFCSECNARYLNTKTDETPGCCDICRKYAPDLKDYRDPDEGIAGRVYQACSECISKTNADAFADTETPEDRHFQDLDLDDIPEEPTDFSPLDYTGND